MFNSTKGHFKRAAQAIVTTTAAAIFVTAAWTPTSPGVVSVASGTEQIVTSGPSHQIFGADAAGEAEFEEAVTAFAAAGLPLPTLRAYFHDTAEGCNGHMGLFSKGGDKHRVDICTLHQTVIRHELAHAWEHHNIDDATRRAFLERIGVAEWNRQDSPARLRAIERAADLVVWGIGSRPIQLMHANRYSEDLETFELLTGLKSPRIAHWDDFTRQAEADLPSISVSDGVARIATS